MIGERIKRALAVIAACASAAACTTASAEDNFKIWLSGMANDTGTLVEFTDSESVNSDGRVLVPLRSVCESAGMKVSWYQPAKTVSVTLTANKDSDKPSERYAYNLLEKEIDRVSPGVVPEDIVLRLAADVSTMDIRYNYSDTANSDTVSLGKAISLEKPPALIDSAVMIPLRAVMEAFGFTVVYEEDNKTVVVGVPEPETDEDLQVMPSFEYLPDSSEVAALTSAAVSKEDPVPTDDPIKGKYLGRFKITHYCPCAKCNGGWNGTAFAGKIVPGRTVGVSLYTLNTGIVQKLQWIYIDGYGLRRIEDYGSGVNELHIDVAIANHNDPNYNTCYRDVWAANYSE